ncbi:hypothetical protein J7J18_00150 [bacterium]|nr:hypothetical protein [bacterium]MCD6147774.1 hypothetical protein [bacterium]
MRKEVFNLKLFFSLIIGILGVIFLFFNFLYLYAPPVAHPYTIFEKITTAHYHLIEKLPLLLRVFFLDFLEELAFLIFLFLSPIGIFLGNKAYESTKQNLAIFAIVLNIINLIFSIFIGWAILGLTTGAM